MSPETIAQLAQGGIGLVGLYFINLLWQEVKLLNQRTWEMLVKQNEQLLALRLAQVERAQQTTDLKETVTGAAAAADAARPSTSRRS